MYSYIVYFSFLNTAKSHKIYLDIVLHFITNRFTNSALHSLILSNN